LITDDALSVDLSDGRTISVPLFFSVGPGHFASFFYIDTVTMSRYTCSNCDTRRVCPMPLSLRIPPKKETMIKKAATREGKTKSAYILEAVDEKLGLVKDREKMIRELAGWLSHDAAEELRKATEIFNQINEGDWD
jgi:predicted DNA-binding protein